MCTLPKTKSLYFVVCINMDNGFSYFFFFFYFGSYPLFYVLFCVFAFYEFQFNQSHLLVTLKKLQFLWKEILHWRVYMENFMSYLNVKLFVATEKLSDFMKMGLKHYKIYCHCVDDGMAFPAISILIWKIWFRRNL